VIRKLALLAAMAALLSPYAVDARKAEDGKGSFLAMDLPKTVFITPLDAAKSLVGAFPETVEGNPSMEVSLYRRPDSDELKMIITTNGLLDDSILAEQYSVGLAQGDAGWSITILGKRWKCARNGKRPKWVSVTCP
jgi:hypothetical protein